MNKETKEKILEMRKAGGSYNLIAESLGLKKDSVKAVCQRNGLGGFATLRNATKL